MKYLWLAGLVLLAGCGSQTPAPTYKVIDSGEEMVLYTHHDYDYVQTENGASLVHSLSCRKCVKHLKELGLLEDSK